MKKDYDVDPTRVYYDVELPEVNQGNTKCRKCRKWFLGGELGDGLCVGCWDRISAQPGRNPTYRQRK